MRSGAENNIKEISKYSVADPGQSFLIRTALVHFVLIRIITEPGKVGSGCRPIRPQFAILRIVTVYRTTLRYVGKNFNTYRYPSTQTVKTHGRS